MEHGASPNLHQELTEALWGWLWSLRPVAQHPARAPPPQHCPERDRSHRTVGTGPSGGTGAQHIPLLQVSHGPEPWRENMKMKLQHSKKSPQQKRSCFQPPHGESGTAESRTGLVTKNEAALKVMNPGHPLKQRPIPVKTQPIPAKTPGVWSTLEFCVPWKIPKQHGQPCGSHLHHCHHPREKTNSQKSSGMSVQAATSAPKPHIGCSSCILATNRLRGQRGIYSHCQGRRKINQQNLLPRG